MDRNEAGILRPISPELDSSMIALQAAWDSGANFVETIHAARRFFGIPRPRLSDDAVLPAVLRLGSAQRGVTHGAGNIIPPLLLEPIFCRSYLASCALNSTVLESVHRVSVI